MAQDYSISATEAQVPSVCRASYSGQQQPALAPAACSRQGSSLPGEQDTILHRFLQPRAAQAAATGHTWPAAGCKTPPLLGLFAAASACILTLCPGLTSAQAAALMPPFHHPYSQLTSSGTPHAFHSPTAILPSVNTDVKPPSLLQTFPHFWICILSLHFLILKTCTCINLGLLLCSLCHSWGIPAFPCVPRQPGHISEAANDNTALHCREGRTRTLKSHFRIFHHVRINVISYDIPDYLSNNDLPLNV